MSTDATRSWRFLLVIGLLAGAVSALIVLPFLNWILVAVILAYVLAPLDRRLSRRLPSSLSAGISITIGLFAIVLPVLVVLGVAAAQTRRLITGFDPEVVFRVDDLIADRFGIQINVMDLQETLSGAISSGARGVVGNVFSIVGGLPELFIGITVMFFVVYYLLKDGDRAAAWLRTVLPLDPEIREDLIDETSLLLYNSLVGTVAVAGVQAVLLGIAFVLVGLQNVVFWTVVTFVAALLPLVGASIIWLPASVYFLVVGRPVAAVALAVFGAVVISTVDNVLRPMVMRRGAQLSPVLTILGIFGGIALFGFVGLFVGPIVLGVTKLLVEMVVRESPERTAAGDPRDGDGRPREPDTNESDTVSTHADAPELGDDGSDRDDRQT
ncbi:AI-2E family transporter [Halohasta salina]|uniref:AI-2E family transporter n=1 Tax=Halohasta salina TaxID=2961621 RepID=UPI0020A5F481|nr:AI-2E family transporter [Halohasta salina]